MIIPILKTEDGVDTVFEFPCGFLNYDPYIPKKRKATKQTCKGSFTQTSKPLFLHGVEEIDWSMNIVTRGIASQLDDLYNADDNYIFEGLYNERYLVDFSDLELIAIGGYFRVNGKFRVICVLEEKELACE